jgi:hypothetical protein
MVTTVPDKRLSGRQRQTSNFNGLPFPKDMAETVPIVLNFGIQASKGARPVLRLSEPEAFSEEICPKIWAGRRLPIEAILPLSPIRTLAAFGEEPPGTGLSQSHPEPASSAGTKRQILTTRLVGPSASDHPAR